MGPVMVARVKNSTRDQSLTCERCSGKLLFDGEALTCLMCGYEAADEDLVHRARTTVPEMLDALVRFRSEIAHCIEAIGTRPAPGSPAERELAAADTDEAAALALVAGYAYQSL